MAGPTNPLEAAPGTIRGAMQLSFEHHIRTIAISTTAYRSSTRAIDIKGTVPAIYLPIASTRAAEMSDCAAAGDLGVHFRRNLIHSSDSIESAEREIRLWFDPSELIR